MIRSDDELLVLHGLRLLGRVPAPAVSELQRLPVELVETHLEAAATAGWVVERRARTARFAAAADRVGSGWRLTPRGREHGEALLSVEIDRHGLRDRIESAYADFRSLNPGLLDVCTRWQVKNLGRDVLNDHTDPVYDARVVAGLREIDGRVQPICGELGRCLARFSGYGPKLSIAVGRVERGEVDWLDKPLIESYHTVWFRLHEDLLATLGRDRASEYGVDLPVAAY